MVPVWKNSHTALHSNCAERSKTGFPQEQFTEYQHRMQTIRSLFLGMLVATIGTTSYGQTNRTEIGIEGGPSMIFLRGLDIFRQVPSMGVGFTGGIYGQFNVSGRTSLHTSIAYERKGSVLRVSFTDINGTITGKGTGRSNYDYLTMPILLRASLGKKGRYFLNAGPYLGYLIQRSEVANAENYHSTYHVDMKSDKRFDTGISAGIGMSIPFKTKFDLSFELRNNLGLYNTSAVLAENDGTIKTNSTVLLFGFGYKFGERIAPSVE